MTARPTISRWSSRTTRCGVLRGTLLLAVLAAGSCAGCVGAFAPGQVPEFSPEALPAAYRADPAAAGQPADLSRFVRRAVPSDRIVRGDLLKIEITGSDERPEDRLSWVIRVGEDGTVRLPIIGPVAVAGHAVSEAEAAIAAAAVAREVYRLPQVTVRFEKRRVVRIAVLGAVRTPGVYELPAGEADLLAAIVHAGGLHEEAGSEVRIQRAAGTKGPDGAPAPLIERYRLDQQDQLVHVFLQDGDAVVVARHVPQSVYVMGLVRRPTEVPLPRDKPPRLLDAIAAAGDRRIQIAERVTVLRYPPDRPTPIRIRTTIARARRHPDDNVMLAPGDVVTVEETPWTFTVETLLTLVRFGFSTAVPFF